MNNEDKKKALRERTKRFAAAVVRLYCSLDKRRGELEVLGKQMLRSGTSVAANYREASRSRSDAEFISKIELCAQEADETQLWLELLNEECGIPEASTQTVWDESDELIAIFVTMSKHTKLRSP